MSPNRLEVIKGDDEMLVRMMRHRCDLRMMIASPSPSILSRLVFIVLIVLSYQIGFAFYPIR